MTAHDLPDGHTYLDQGRHRPLYIDSQRRIQRSRENVLDGSTQVDLHDLDPEGQVTEAQTHDLRIWMSCHLQRNTLRKFPGHRIKYAAYLGIVPDLGKEVETQAALHTTCTTSPLSGITLRNERLNETADLPLLIEPHLAVLPSVDDAGDVWNGDTSLGNVGRCSTHQRHSRQQTSGQRTYDDLPDPWRRNVEDCPLLFTGDRGMQRIYAELILGTESPVLGEHVVQPPDLAHARHEDQNGTRVRRIRCILEAYAFKQPDDEVVGNETFVKEVDSGDRCWRVTLFKGYILLLTGIVVVVFSCRIVFCPITGLVAIELVPPCNRVNGCSCVRS